MTSRPCRCERCLALAAALRDHERVLAELAHDPAAVRASRTRVRRAAYRVDTNHRLDVPESLRQHWRADVEAGLIDDEELT